MAQFASRSPSILAVDPTVGNPWLDPVESRLVERHPKPNFPLVERQLVPRTPEIELKCLPLEPPTLPRRIAHLIGPRRIRPPIGVRQTAYIYRKEIDSRIDAFPHGNA